MTKLSAKFTESVKPMYYKALWHNCSKCRIHFMSESPHLTAYLCDECFNSMPHYRTKPRRRFGHIQRGTVKKKQQKVAVRAHDEFWGLLLYIFGCSLCLLIIGYYLWA